MRNFKHRYEIKKDLSSVFIDEKTHFTVDTEDLFKVLRYKWVVDKKGYVKNATVGYLHRFLMQAPNDKRVDHISHNVLNNSKKNLRLATESENSFNRLTYATGNRLGVRGVTIQGNKYHAKFQFSGEEYDLGSYNTLHEAEAKIVDTRWKVSNFSEVDNPDINEELLKEQKNRNIAIQATKLKLPKFYLECCYRQFSVDKHRKFYRCFLHLPLSTKNQEVKFCISYRFKCPKCGRMILVTYEYNKNAEVINVLKVKKTVNTMAMLANLIPLHIKDIPLCDKYLGTTKTYTGYDRWYYGVPINIDAYKRKTLDGADAGIVFVDTQKRLRQIRKEAEHELWLKQQERIKNKELLEVQK